VADLNTRTRTNNKKGLRAGGTARGSWEGGEKGDQCSTGINREVTQGAKTGRREKVGLAGTEHRVGKQKNSWGMQ